MFKLLNACYSKNNLVGFTHTSFSQETPFFGIILAFRRVTVYEVNSWHEAGCAPFTDTASVWFITTPSVNVPQGLASLHLTAHHKRDRIMNSNCY